MLSLKPDPRRRPSKFNLALGDQIRIVSTYLGVSQRQLSLKSGIRLDHLQLYQKGLRPPTCRALGRIAQALGTPVDSLLPPAALEDPANNALYQSFRLVWFLPLEAKHSLAKIVDYFVTAAGLPRALGATTLLPGGSHAPRT